MSDTDERNEEAEAFDPESRRLCPDDTCIGVIGPDGKCKECGAESPDGPPPAADATAKDAVPAKQPAPKAVAVSKGDPEGFDPDERILCSDDTCTGLVGPDGTCKECGKAYAG